MTTPFPFQLNLPEARLAAMQNRLAQITWPDQPPGAEWDTGSSLAFMRDLVAYWRDGFDWRARERSFNALPQFTMTVDGTELHFVHQAGVGPAPMPLMLLHGWPSSVLDFRELIPLLTNPASHGGNPADAFTVVAPSLPGYTLSFRPGQARLNLPGMAAALGGLMVQLGYGRFGVQGGDWGAVLAAILGRSLPDRVIGLQLSMLPCRLPGKPTGPEEAAYAAEQAAWMRDEAGYQAIQGTRPQTLAYALQDSPVGLAAWMVEKFRAWSDGGLSRDQMLEAVTLYWATGAVGSSFWPYRAIRQDRLPFGVEQPVAVPVGYASFPREMLRPPRSVAELTFTDIRRWTAFKQGGHFPAMERPAELADEIRAMFRPLRNATSGGTHA